MHKRESQSRFEIESTMCNKTAFDPLLIISPMSLRSPQFPDQGHHWNSPCHGCPWLSIFSISLPRRGSCGLTRAICFYSYQCTCLEPHCLFSAQDFPTIVHGWLPLQLYCPPDQQRTKVPADLANCSHSISS